MKTGKKTKSWGYHLEYHSQNKCIPEWSLESKNEKNSHKK